MYMSYVHTVEYMVVMKYIFYCVRVFSLIGRNSLIVFYFFPQQQHFSLLLSALELPQSSGIIADPSLILFIQTTNIGIESICWGVPHDGMLLILTRNKNYKSYIDTDTTISNQSPRGDSKVRTILDQLEQIRNKSRGRPYQLYDKN